jgi:broad specificity phosphatase PhoE
VTTYLIRHGQTDWNAEFRLQGQQDIPLNDLGRRQAAENGRLLKERAGDLSHHHFVSSPLSRARETMELVRASAGLPAKDYAIDERLVEISFGDWEGSTNAEIAVNSPEKIKERKASKWDFVPPGERAESYEILSWRVGSWLKELDRPTVCVCHGGVIRCIFKLTGMLDKRSAARLYIPQDKILKFEDGRLEWA